MSPRTSLPNGRVWTLWYAQIRVPPWHKTHSDSYAAAPDINVLVKVSWSQAPSQVPGYHDIIVQCSVRNHARVHRAIVWDCTEHCYGGGVYRGPLMLGGNLGNWIKTEPDLYIGGLCHVIITESYKCTMSAICIQSTTGSTVIQFISSQNCEIVANIAQIWLRMSGIQGLLSMLSMLSLIVIIICVI